LANGLAIELKLLLIATVGIHFSLIYPRFQQQIVTIKHQESSGWAIDDVAVRVLASTTLCQFVVFLNFINQSKPRSRPQSVLVFCDALNEDDFRQLVVRLKISFIQQQVIITTEKI
jgi:hypothetical protein